LKENLKPPRKKKKKGRGMRVEGEKQEPPSAQTGPAGVRKRGFLAKKTQSTSSCKEEKDERRSAWERGLKGCQRSWERVLVRGKRIGKARQEPARRLHKKKNLSPSERGNDEPPDRGKEEGNVFS